MCVCVCAMFHIQGSKANYKSNKSLTHKITCKVTLFLEQQEGGVLSSFCHYSLVCVFVCVCVQCFIYKALDQTVNQTRVYAKMRLAKGFALDSCLIYSLA